MAPNGASVCSTWPSAAWPSRPGVASVIAGATSAEQLRANVAAGEWVPSTDDITALDAVLGAP